MATSTNKTEARDAGGNRADSTKRRALGKGLESLLNRRGFEEQAARSSAAASAKAGPNAAEHTPGVAHTIAASSLPQELGSPREILMDLIDSNPYQTRQKIDPQKLEDLRRSIEANGVIQPILVRGSENGRFQLIAGERRMRASRLAGNTTIPAILRTVSESQAMEMTIVENLQRADLNPMEQARAFERLGKEFRMTQEQIALRTGKERTSVANFLRLLKLPAEVQAKIESGELSYGHGRALLALDTQDAMMKVAEKVSAMSMSVRQTENYIQGVLNPEKRREGEQKGKQPMDANVRHLQDLLQRELGLKVQIEDKNGRGRVVIHYSRLEDFDALMRAWGGKY